MKRKIIGLLLLVYGLYVWFGELLPLPKIPLLVIGATIVIGASVIKRLLRRKYITSAFLLMVLFVIYNHHWQFVKIGTGALILGFLVITVALGLIFKPRVSFLSMNNWKDFSLLGKWKSKNNYNVMFGESTKHIYANEIEDVFQSECLFGEVLIYLHDVGSVNQTVTLHTTTRFGETILYVPSNWEIINDVSVSFGEIRLAKDVSVKNNTVILKGDVSFGELVIRYI